MSTSAKIRPLVAVVAVILVLDLPWAIQAAVAREPAPESATLRWNFVARALVRKGYVDPLWAVRTYALVSVAQHDAALSVTPALGASDQDRTLVAAGVAVSSATVLAHLFPHEVPRLAVDLETDLTALRPRAAAAALDTAIVAARSVAERVIAERAGDGALSLQPAVIPVGEGRWYSSERRPPLRPDWGQVRPMLIADTDGIPVPPPPAMGSPEFAAALAEVREHTRVASARQDALVRKWADGPGTATPPGHWNEIAADLIRTHGLDDAEAARVFAVMNMALLDVSIVCWRAKYEYWLLRPPQADPRIVPSIALPNFPSYPSGHAAFSGTAASFLAYRFPGDRERLEQLGEEAAESRVIGGIHFPFDSAEGLRQGRQLADIAVIRYRAGGALLRDRSRPPTGTGRN